MPISSSQLFHVILSMHRHPIMESDRQIHVQKSQLEENQVMACMENLPDGILFNIFSRLPISSLIQVKYVCRSWRLLVRDRRVLDLHNSTTDDSYLCLIFHCDYPIKNRLFFVDFPAFNYVHEMVKMIQMPFSASMPEFDLVGSCNGLLLLFDSVHNDAIYIYNPFTRDYKQLPKCTEYIKDELVFGFGVHPTTKEFKVVKIVCPRNENRLPQTFRHSYRRSHVEIFTSSSSTWRSVGQIGHHLVQWPSQTLVHGRVHWVGWPCRNHPGRPIVSFDLADEEFREVPKPDCGGLSGYYFHVLDMGGLLSAAVYSIFMKLEIWIMEDYGVKESWIKKFIIESYMPKELKQGVDKYSKVSKIILHRRCVRVLCRLKNGKILLEYKSRALVLFDPESGEVKDLTFQGIPSWFQTIVHQFGN